MKNETPLKAWFKANRWTAPKAAKELGISSTAINFHLRGDAFPRADKIAAYKCLGVPSEVIQEHIKWMIDNAECTKNNYQD
jgi:hypothetical protein